MKTTRNLLLLGGSHSEVPLISAAQELDYKVTTLSSNENDIGHQFADDNIHADYSDQSTVLKIVEDRSVDAIFAGCNDFAALTAAYVAEKLGLPGHDSVKTCELIHHKDQFAFFAMQNAISVPQFDTVSQENINNYKVPDSLYPVIVKPIDLTGGKGIEVVSNQYSLKKTLEKSLAMSRQPRLIVQKYIRGSYHAVSAFVTNQKIVFHFFDNEHYFANKFLVGAASYPTMVSDDLQKRILMALQNLVESLSLSDGILHVQFVVDESQDFYFLDVCRRPPGDMYIRLVEYATGVNYSALILAPALGLNGSRYLKTATDHSETYWIRHCLMSEKSGVFESITPPESMRGSVVHRVPLVHQGHVTVDPSKQKYEIDFLKFNSRDDFDHYLDLASAESFVQLK